MSPVTEKMLADLSKIVCGNYDFKSKQEAIEIAYEMGKSEGRVEGAHYIVEGLVKPTEKTENHDANQ